jgi:hypothetical protein
VFCLLVNLLLLEAPSGVISHDFWVGLGPLAVLFLQVVVLLCVVLQSCCTSRSLRGKLLPSWLPAPLVQDLSWPLLDRDLKRFGRWLDHIYWHVGHRFPTAPLLLLAVVGTRRVFVRASFPRE